jgi:hypothetical protein
MQKRGMWCMIRVNQSHQIVIVAATLDASSERIVGYLNRRDIPINVLCFQVFEAEGSQLLSRVWLLDRSRHRPLPRRSARLQ